MASETQDGVVNSAELIALGATDSEFFARTFFPKTTRQRSPQFHREVDRILDSDARLISLQMFRGSAKTSKLRIYGAKRIAYGLSHTILWVGKSQEHAIHSVKWLKKQIEYNRLYSQTFQLTPGSKWQDVEIEIKHGLDEYPITVLAFGITGSIRGVNIDDYRPDLIILDDILDEENTATLQQRQKTEALVYGALKDSLAPKSDVPDAKMVMLQTPHNIEDVSMKSLKDPEWISARFGCWTRATENSSLTMRESVWPERIPSAELREEKSNAIRRNQLSIFTREKECRIISAETSAFKAPWLQYYDQPPDDCYCVLAIDPVPPPSELEVEKGLAGKDSEAIVIVGKHAGKYILLDYSMNTGHDPSWTASECFRLSFKWRPKRWVVESVAYQRVLAWLLRKAMQEQRKYYPIREFTDKRKKYSRILDALNGISSNGQFLIKKEMADFIQQFSEYPNVAHDDLLDAVSIAISDLDATLGDFETFEEILNSEKDLPKLSYNRGAP